MNGLKTIVDSSIILVGAYVFLIGMDWMEKHHAILHYHNKTFMCMDDDGK